MAASAAPISREIAIRMYNVGFGDAFLVVIPNGASCSKILFDCGSIQAADNYAMVDIVKSIVQQATDADGVPRIDVVVATHRHKDHVSGFANDDWDSVEVKEVWMPWTEDETDAEARRIRDIQSRLAIALDRSLSAQAAAMGATPPVDFTRYQNVVNNALMLSNDKAMKTLHSGFTGEAVRRFLPTKVSAERSFTTKVLPGIKIHVMGPARSADVIRDMDPPKGQTYLRLNATLATQAGLPPAPFEADFVDAAAATAAYLLPDDQVAIQTAGSMSDLAVAVALDKAVNGTSLMLMLEVSGTYLLFPGDAQWGTWQAAMADAQWREMLSRVSFYKIGHHGSHNATPKDFVEKMMPDSISAMASTLTRDIWPDIPKAELLSALANKNARVVRSDQENLPMPPGFTVDRGVVEVRIPF
jgi:beta-lactamase superfamily II metal-dependent hydrolase